MGTWTEAAFWSAFRSYLRRMFRFTWIPAKTALEQSRRPSQHPTRKLKWEHQCKFCHKWFARKEVELDHLEPCGPLNCWEDVEPFVKRLLLENPDDYAVLCKSCHGEKTALEKEARAEEKLQAESNNVYKQGKSCSKEVSQVSPHTMNKYTTAHGKPSEDEPIEAPQPTPQPAPAPTA
jgi:hypothetical protein